MKVYVDFTADKISAQQNTQHDIKDKLCQMGVYTEKKEDADILLYTQIINNREIVDEWKNLKSKGKKIVFIHHYMSENFYNKVGIVLNNDALHLVDFHIVISNESELYYYLLSQNIQKKQIFILELATTEYNRIYKQYYRSAEEKENSILFAGRYCKGLDEFVDYVNKNDIKNASIMSLDVHKSQKDLSRFSVYTNRSRDGVFDVMKTHQFLFCPIVYTIPRFHLERTMQEAIACGCIPVVPNEYCRIMNTLDMNSIGFINMYENYLSYSKEKLNEIQQAGIKYQREHYLDYNDTIDEIIKLLYVTRSAS